MNTCKECKKYGRGQCLPKHKQMSPNAPVCLDFKLREAKDKHDTNEDESNLNKIEKEDEKYEQ